jgi:hypothetical protein
VVEVIPVDKYSSTGVVGDLLGEVENELIHGFTAISLRYASTAVINCVIDRDNCTGFALDPGFGAQCQVYSHRVGAVHEPNTSNKLEQPYKAKARFPGQ